MNLNFSTTVFWSISSPLALAVGVLSVNLPPAFAQTGADVVRARPVASRSAEEQQRILLGLKEQLAKLPREPEPSADEPIGVREARKKRAKLDALVREIELRIEAERVPAYQDPAQKVYGAYYSRLVTRVELEANKNPPTRAGSSLRGHAEVVLTIKADGQLESVRTGNVTSEEFGHYVVALITQLAPFEPFDVEMQKNFDRLVIRAPFSYGPR